MEQNPPAELAVGRRRILLWCLAAGCVGAPMPSWAGSLGGTRRSLSFVNLHTGETLAAIYWSKGTYQRGALTDINHLLRDFRTGDVHAIDVRLLDLLNVLQLKMRARSPFQVISGYRSPATNAMLAARSDGVARQSYHVKGMAIDVSLADRQLPALRDAALDLRAGGVGYYPKPGFVHVDVGPVRTW